MVFCTHSRRAFSSYQSPQLIILHEEHVAGGSNMHYFDLLIRLKTEQEHLFRNIQRNEYHSLFDFISSKELKIMNVGDGHGQPTEGGVSAVRRSDDDDAVDPHLERIRNAAVDESDEEILLQTRTTRVPPTDDSGEDGSDASVSGDEERPAKKEKKDPIASKASSKKSEDGNEEGSKKKKQKKKDTNAPKKALSGYMFFSQAERENVRKENPGIAFQDIAKVIGDKWRKMTEFRTNESSF